jgi:hypothetical protein
VGISAPIFAAHTKRAHSARLKINEGLSQALDYKKHTMSDNQRSSLSHCFPLFLTVI